MSQIGPSAKSLLRAEMARRSITYDELSARLADAGVIVSSQALRSKIARGAFSANTFVACLIVLGVEHLRLHD